MLNLYVSQTWLKSICPCVVWIIKTCMNTDQWSYSVWLKNMNRLSRHNSSFISIDRCQFVYRYNISEHWHNWPLYNILKRWIIKEDFIELPCPNIALVTITRAITQPGTHNGPRMTTSIHIKLNLYKTGLLIW